MDEERCANGDGCYKLVSNIILIETVLMSMLVLHARSFDLDISIAQLKNTSLCFMNNRKADLISYVEKQIVIST